MNATVRTLLLGILLTGFITGARGGDVAIVVNPENPMDELSSKDLCAIFELRQRSWPNRNLIAVATLKSDMPERELILSRVYHRSEEALTRYWRLRIFKAEITDIPEVMASRDKLKQWISRLRNGISFIDASAVDATVKVLRIDGRLPGEPGYVLHAGDET